MGGITEAKAGSHAAAAASRVAHSYSLFQRDESGRLGFAHQLEAAEKHKAAARLWRVFGATEGREDKAKSDLANDMVHSHRAQADEHLSLVPSTLGGAMLPEVAQELELGRRVEQHAYVGITAKAAEQKALQHIKENPRYYSELNVGFQQAGTAPWAKATAEQLAAQGVAQLEATLRTNPPVGVTSADVGRLFSNARDELEAVLLTLIHEAQITPEERDLRLTMAAGRALRSLKPPRIRRLATIAEAGEKGYSVPYHQVPPQEAAAWTRELKNLSRWELVVGDGWRWRLTPLGQRVLRVARDVPALSESQLTAYATKYRSKGGPLPATEKSARMVLGGKILKLDDEALHPLLEVLNQGRRTA